MNKKKLFDYNLEVLQVSQLAAISVFDFIGKKDETAADKAAVESMRKELNKINSRYFLQRNTRKKTENNNIVLVNSKHKMNRLTNNNNII